MDEIKIPDLGGFQDIEIIEMPVAEGDSVEVDDALLVLETDKATMEIPAPVAGVVNKFSVKVGDKVNEGDVFALMTSSAPSEEVIQENNDDLPIAALEPLQHVTDEIEDKPAKEQSVKEQAVIVPDIGGSTDVSVIEVSVEVGQSIDLEDTIVVLETDKATMELPAPVAGVIQLITTKVGDKVNEGDQIAVIQSNAADEAKELNQSPKDVEEKVKVQSVGADSSIDTQTRPSSTEQGSLKIGESKVSSSVYAGPAVRKLAREFGVSMDDVLKLTGSSGPKGRILQEDIQNYVKRRLSDSESTKGSSGMGIEPIPEVDFSRFGNVRRESLTRIQKISSQHLHRCWVNVPHVTQFDEIDITELEAFRKGVNKEGTYDVKLTLIPFLIKAVQKVLSEMPRFNASLAPEGDAIIVKEYYHIGVAVDTEQGLMVPVVKDVDTKSILNIAADCMQYALQARDGKLRPDALQGSCFSISSLGGIGGTQFTPIVNAPEVAILGVSKASIKPVWIGEQWKPRLILPVALSYDHRVIDGVLAAKFTTRIKQLLEDSRHLLL